MKCPHCKQDNDRVVDSRISQEGAVIRRRRECLSCYLRYTTYERVEETPLRVIKKSGERVRFERERILNGMALACEKLPVSMEDLERQYILAALEKAEGNKSRAAGLLGMTRRTLYSRMERHGIRP